MTRETPLAEYASAHASGHVTVDVRDPDEYAEGHVPGARSIPLSTLAEHVDELTAEQPVYVICASGNRSKAGAELLSRAGVDARSVAGGTAAWVSAGHPVDGGAQR